MKSLFFLPLVLLLLCNIISSCSSSKSKGDAENDSIAIAKLDSLRQDSIRQDSIMRRNFLTPDLAFYDLHGDVKECVFDHSPKEGVEFVIYRFPEKNISFNEAGEITNLKDPNDYQRDESGYIISSWKVNYDWDNERLISFTYDLTYSSNEVYLKYNENGLLLSADEYEYSDDIHHHNNYIISDYEVDEVGNWVSRRVHKISRLTFISTGNTRTYFRDGFETRVITYHKSNGGKITSLPNNDLQKQALTEYREYERKKASKNEDYDDYSASSSNKVTSYANQQYDESPSFRIPSDVSIYLSDKTFKGENYDGDRLSIKIKQDCVYANGAAITAAPRISIVSPTTAIIKASNVYAGGSDITFYLDANNGTLTLQSSGEKLYLSK